MGLKAVANPLAGSALPSNVTSASLNSITPSGDLLDVQGSVWAKLTGAQNTTFRGLRFGVVGSVNVYGGSEMNLDSGEVRHTAGYAGYGGYHTWYANGNLKATLNDTGLYLYDTQTITANSASAALNLTQSGAGPSINTNSFIQGAEQTAPSAPAANGYRIFAQDNGAGKTQLMVIFATGAAQQIAIEP